MKSRILQFTVVFERAEEGGYIARVPALPGCMSQGETIEEAENMIKDAIRAYCKSLQKHKESVPTDVEELVESITVSIAA